MHDRKLEEGEAPPPEVHPPELNDVHLIIKRRGTQIIDIHEVIPRSQFGPGAVARLQLTDLQRLVAEIERYTNRG